MRWRSGCGQSSTAPFSLLCARAISLRIVSHETQVTRCPSPGVEALEVPSVLLSPGRAINLMIGAQAFSGCAAKRILRYHKARHRRRALCRNRPLTIDRVSFNVNNVGAHWGNSWGGCRATLACGDCGDSCRFFAEAVQKSRKRRLQTRARSRRQIASRAKSFNNRHRVSQRR